jgi:hypothetical protein
MTNIDTKPMYPARSGSAATSELVLIAGVAALRAYA